MRPTTCVSRFLFALCIFVAGKAPSLFALDPINIKDGGPPIVTSESIIFRYRDARFNPTVVRVNGEFNRWEDPLVMRKNRYGVFVCVFDKRDERSVVVREGIYTYRYLVDGVWVRDPSNPNVHRDSYGTELSYFAVDAPVIIADRNPVPVGRNDYVFYYKNRSADTVRIVGDFNNWNPYSHPMVRNKSGIWEVTLDIPPGTYLYRFIVDGVFKTDPLNRNLVTDRFDNQFSRLLLRQSP